MPLFCIIESTRRRRTSGGRSPATTAAERRHSNRSSPAGLEHRKKSHPSDDSFFYLFESTRRDSNPRPSPWQGDTPPLSHSCTTYLQNHILKSSLPFHQPTRPSWISPRPISNSQLHALLHFHLCPIYLVVLCRSSGCAPMTGAIIFSMFSSRLKISSKGLFMSA